ncbi:carbon-nitrogen hydrolase family protein [Nitrosomonas sp.]|uniref:carbon-nitrogen hydrolase family protein n=1 Tax=Nitrosomonas sp. TaxID=42353 RepID=UPI0026351F45|nr:carbon-nitrogen hydrolase family protein [Nitrosomonas sp.]
MLNDSIKHNQPAIENEKRASFRVAAIQMASGPSVSANLEEAARLIEEAASQKAELVVLPEYFCIMGMKDTDKLTVREQPGDGQIQKFLSDTAKRLGIWLVGGSVPLASSEPDKVYNSCLVYADNGEQVARYDKIHLFGLQLGHECYAEEKTIKAGSEVVTIDSPFGRIGLSICYDLRFPELFRMMNNVDIILAPAAFTAITGRAHWEILVRARAVENMAYVIAPGQGGYHVNGRETNGDSMIVDPWGVVMERLPRGPGAVVATLDPGYQASLRTNLPALDHRILQYC